jgi:hypothetical protein
MNWSGVIKESALPVGIQRLPVQWGQFALVQMAKSRLTNGFIQVQLTFELAPDQNASALFEFLDPLRAQPLQFAIPEVPKQFITRIMTNLLVLLPSMFGLRVVTFETDPQLKILIPKGETGALYLDPRHLQEAQQIDLKSLAYGYIPSRHLSNLTWTALLMSKMPDLWTVGTPDSRSQYNDFPWYEGDLPNEYLLNQEEAERQLHDQGCFSLCLSQLSFKELILFNELETAFELRGLELPEKLLETRFPCVNYLPPQVNGQIWYHREWAERALQSIMEGELPGVCLDLDSLHETVVVDGVEMNTQDWLIENSHDKLSPYYDGSVSDGTIMIRTVCHRDLVQLIRGPGTSKTPPEIKTVDLDQLPDLIQVRTSKDAKANRSSSGIQIHPRPLKASKDARYLDGWIYTNVNIPELHKAWANGTALTNWGHHFWAYFHRWSVASLSPHLLNFDSPTNQTR